MKKRNTVKASKRPQTPRVHATLALDVRLGHDDPLKVELATANGRRRRRDPAGRRGEGHRC